MSAPTVVNCHALFRESASRVVVVLALLLSTLGFASFSTSRVNAVAWTPASLGSSLALWLDASDASTITSTGGLVSEWRDKSGNSRHATQATSAYQPSSS